jgi:hypothetical protein
MGDEPKILAETQVRQSVNSKESRRKISKRKMRAVTIVLAFALAIASALAFPQNYEEAVKQAQQMSLIPAGAQIDRTFPGQQVAYFQLGSNDRVNNGDLRQALEGIPPEIIANLEAQIARAQ